MNISFLTMKLSALRFLLVIILLLSASPLVMSQLPFGNAICLDGDWDWISTDNMIPLSYDGMTIEMWLNTTDDSGDVFGWYNPQSVYVVNMGIWPPGVLFFDNAFSPVFGTVAINTGNWTHIAVVKSGTSVTFYVNGIPDVTRTVTAPAPEMIVSCFGGCPSTHWMTWFTGGLFDEIRYWNIARTQAEIQSTMYCELSGMEPGLIAYYNCNQGVPGGDNLSIEYLNSFDPFYNGGLLGFAKTGSCSNFNEGQNLPVIFNATGGGHYCEGTPGMEVGLSNSQANVTYQLYRGFTSVGGIIPGICAPLSWPGILEPGFYKVSATSLSGTVMMNDSVEIIMDPTYQPGLTGPLEVCLGSLSQVYRTESGMANYLWSVSAGGAITSGGTTISDSVSVQWATSGDQSVSVNYSNAFGCMAQNSSILNILAYNTLSPAGNITGDTSVCNGMNNVIYSIDPIPGAGSYSWSIPAGATILSGSGSNAITVDFGMNAVSGMISVYGTNFCGNSASSELAVAVNPYPLPPLIEIIGDTILTSNYPDGNQWHYEGNPIPGANDQTHVPQYSGSYYDVVTLHDCPSDPSNSLFIVVSGIAEKIPEGEISVYPSPGAGHFTVSLNNLSEGPFHVKIMNSSGINVFEKTASSSTKTFEFDLESSGCMPGYYFVVIDHRAGQLVRKIILAR